MDKKTERILSSLMMAKIAGMSDKAKDIIDELGAELANAKETPWERAGEVGVDAGLMYLGDPCYFIGKDQPPSDFQRSWDEFCDQLNEQTTQLYYDKGHAGLGVVISTGGDGCFPVEVQKTDYGQIKAVRIIFMED